MKKVNILLDDDTFDKLKAVTFALDKSPTELLKPYIERIIRDNAETVKKKLLFTADQFTDADKTVELKSTSSEQTNGSKHDNDTLDSNEPQQVTEGGKLQLDDADTLRQKATQFKDLIKTAKNGQRYLLKKQKTTINGLDTKYPVFADGKQHQAYLLPADLQEATESPTSDGNKS